MITSKQRAFLKSLANGIDTILLVGKEGISNEVIKQANDALIKRELIKGKVLNNSDMSAAEISRAIAEETGAQVVQVIGSKFILYKRNNKKPKIELPKKVSRKK